MTCSLIPGGLRSVVGIGPSGRSGFTGGRWWSARMRAGRAVFRRREYILDRILTIQYICYRLDDLADSLRDTRSGRALQSHHPSQIVPSLILLGGEPLLGEDRLAQNSLLDTPSGGSLLQKADEIEHLLKIRLGKDLDLPEDQFLRLHASELIILLQ